MKQKILFASIIATGYICFTNGQGNPNETAESTGTFVKNDGQLIDTDGNLRNEILYYGKFSDKQMYFAKDKASYVWFKKGDAATNAPDTLARMDMDFMNSNSTAQILSEQQEQGYLNFFKPHIPDGVVNVPTFEKITYNNIYANTDLAVRKREGKVEFEFTLHPGANPDDIKLKFTGADKVEITPGGELKIEHPTGQSEFRKPEGIGVIGAGQTPVNVTLIKDGNNVVGIAIVNFQTNKEYKIVIGEKKLPPVPIQKPTPGKKIEQYWATYYGNTGAAWGDGVLDVHTDVSNNVYICGNTYDPDFPTFNGIETFSTTANCAGVNCPDAFVVKFNPQRGRVFATFYGGGDWEYCQAVTTDANGNIYFGGNSNSTDFPICTTAACMSGFFRSTITGNNDMFIVKLNPLGNTKLWATFFGGNGGNEYLTCMNIDINGNLYIGGATSATNQFDLQNQSGAYNQTTHGGGLYDGFIAKFNSSKQLIWSTYLGGDNTSTGGGLKESVTGITTDNSGFLHVIGHTTSTGTYISNNTPVSGSFPLKNPGSGAYTQNNNGQLDVFVCKFDQTGSLIWSTMFGGSGDESTLGGEGGVEFYNGIIITPNKNIYIVSKTTGGSNFPIMNLTGQGKYNQATFGGGDSDGFIAKFDQNYNLKWSTFYGGSGNDVFNGISHDINGNYFIVGHTTSTNFPVKNSSASFFQNTNNGLTDIAILAFSNSDIRQWATYYGGSDKDLGIGIEIIDEKNLFIAGLTVSQNFPTKDLTGTSDYYDGAISNGGFLPAGYIVNFKINQTPNYKTAPYVNESTVNNNEGEIIELSNDKQNIVLIYPNPVNKQLFIEINEEENKLFSASLHNITGELMLNQQIGIGKNEILLDKISPGIYFFKISSETTIEHRKVIIQ